jgi:hypothetical protein
MRRIQRESRHFAAWTQYEVSPTSCEPPVVVSPQWEVCVGEAREAPAVMPAMEIGFVKPAERPATQYGGLMSWQPRPWQSATGRQSHAEGLPTPFGQWGVYPDAPTPCRRPPQLPPTLRAQASSLAWKTPTPLAHCRARRWKLPLTHPSPRILHNRAFPSPLPSDCSDCQPPSPIPDSITPPLAREPGGSSPRLPLPMRNKRLRLFQAPAMSNTRPPGTQTAQRCWSADLLLILLISRIFSRFGFASIFGNPSKA